MQRTDRTSIGTVVQRFRRMRQRYRQLVATERALGRGGETSVEGATSVLRRVADVLRPYYCGTPYVVEALAGTRKVVVYHQSSPHSDPVLVVEVTAQHDGEDDLHRAGRYSLLGVPEYWQLKVEERCLGVSCDPSAVVYQTRQTLYEGGQVTPPGAIRSIRIADLFS